MIVTCLRFTSLSMIIHIAAKGIIWGNGIAPLQGSHNFLKKSLMFRWFKVFLRVFTFSKETKHIFYEIVPHFSPEIEQKQVYWLLLICLKVWTEQKIYWRVGNSHLMTKICWNFKRFRGYADLATLVHRK